MRAMSRRRVGWVGLAMMVAGWSLDGAWGLAAEGARLTVLITAEGSTQSAIPNPQSPIEIPCRVYLSAGDRQFFAPGCPAWKADGGFCCPGTFEIGGLPSEVDLLVERGPEWSTHRQSIALEPGTSRTVHVSLARWIDMNARGWFSGDLHVHRPLADMPLLMWAEDLNVAPVLTHWNQQEGAVEPPYLRQAIDREAGLDRPRCFRAMSQEDERIGGALLFFNLDRPVAPIPLRQAYRWWPSGWAYHRAALEQKAHVEQEKPFWWEAPVNVALGKIATLEIAHNHFQRRGMMENEAWGRPREKDRYPGQAGFCRYTLDLYYRYLNLGWDIPASAGSASGVLANPVGYNRAYVKMDRFDYDGWFDGLRAGRNFVTNGPMLFATVNGEGPGARLRSEPGKGFSGRVKFEALSRGPLDRAEVVVGGNVVETFRPSGDAKRIEGEFEVALDRSGWIAVRVFETGTETVRFAHTSPFYVNVGDRPRRDAAAAAYYIQWIDDLIAKTKSERASFKSAEHLEEALAIYGEARKVYEKLLKEAQGS